MNSALRQKRVVDTILTKVVMGYDLDQEFSGHHLFPDVQVMEMGGKIIKWGKESFVIMNTTRAPGETVRGVGIAYSSDEYVLQNRLLEAITPEEYVEVGGKLGIALKTKAVNRVFRIMRLEGEYDKALLANNPNHYHANHKTTLSGSDRWNDPTANLYEQVGDAKSSIRAKTGRDPNVFHLNPAGYEGMKRNNHIRERFKYSSKASITLDMLANYFDVEKVVVGRSIHAPDVSSDFQDIWKDNSQLAYVPPKSRQDKEEQSFGYNYVHKGFPKVEKERFEPNDRSYHQPVLFRDKAAITDNTAGYLFQNTAGTM